MTSEGLEEMFKGDFAEMCAMRKSYPTLFNLVYFMAIYGCVFKQKFNKNYLWIATDTIQVFSESYVAPNFPL